VGSIRNLFKIEQLLPKQISLILLSALFVLAFVEQALSAEIEISQVEFKLTSVEKAWLKNNNTIKIGGPRAFPPFHYYDEEGELKGISADYIFSIMNQLGVTVEVQKNLPWPEVLEKAKSGEIDLIPCIAKTRDREVYLDFSTPYLSFPLVILSRKDAPFIGGIEDLHRKKLAVIKKNATVFWLKQDNVNFNPYYVESPLKKLEAVSLGHADAGIENLAAASYLIQKHGLTNIKVVAPTPYGSYNLHMAVQKDLPVLLGIINKTLNLITQEQHMQIKNKWLSVRYEHGIQTIDIIRWVLIIIFISICILGVILIWNRKLKKEIAERKKLINDLEEALAEIKTLKGIVPICSNCKKIRDDKGYWNLLESFIEKHSEASFSHGMCPECSDKLYGDEDWYTKMKQKKDQKE